MNIMVFDVPAESGGAVSILTDFYNEILEQNDKNINWIFVLSTPFLEEKDNIQVLRFPWIKKSWGHRLFFDRFIAPYLVKKHKVEEIFSLQNIIIPWVICKQTLYVHQSLPFSQYQFGFKEDRLLWIYQNVIGKKIFKSIKVADSVIVQSEWMKKVCVDSLRIEEKKIRVLPPRLKVNISHTFSYMKMKKTTFFYPTNAMRYKNIELIVEACRQLCKKGFSKFEVVITLKGNETKYIEELYKRVKDGNLPIKFIGQKLREDIFKWYTKSILLFPSKIESFGLPLLEARHHNCVILASDLPYSHEILDGYENGYFFDPDNVDNLTDLMGVVINNYDSKLFRMKSGGYCEV